MSKTSAILILASAVAMVVAIPSSAQFKVNNGNALDANTLGGSYGSNSPVQPPNVESLNGNQLVTGNVTLGRSLQTNVGYTAPSALRTTTGAEGMEQFIRDSVGVPAPYSGPTNFVEPHAYYGGADTASPPPGFTRNKTTGAYVPVVPNEPQMGYDTRIGLINPGGVAPSYSGLTPIQSILPPEPVSGQQLYGPRATGTVAELSTNPLFSAYQQWNSQDLADLNPSVIAQMRQQVNQSAVAPTAAPAENAPPSNTANAPGTPGTTNGQPANAPPGVTPSALNAQPLNPTPIGQTVLAQSNQNNANNQNTQVPPALVSPEQQSTQYAELEARFKRLQQTTEQSTTPQSTFGTANQSAPQPAFGTANQGKAALPGATGTLPQPQQARRAELYPPSVPKSPLEINSLAAGFHAPALRHLMAEAENRMRQGHFAEALLRYETAAEVAPNNPLIALGQSYAELGAGYYARADRDLRTSLMADPALTMGKYDLKNFFGNTRLEFLVHDLKQITAKDKDNSHAPFLLAYIAYNTGNTDSAAKYLKLAAQREKGSDPIYQLLEKDWNLPATKTNNQKP